MSHITHPLIFTSIKIPHLTSKLTVKRKQDCKIIYVKAKRYYITGSFSAICAKEIYSLSKDIVASKIEGYGYKALLTLALGPLIQIISLPLYILTTAMYAQKYVVSFARFGSEIMRGQHGLANLMFLVPDVLIFGEPVPITDRNDFFIYSNSTNSSVIDTIAEIVDTVPHAVP